MAKAKDLTGFTVGYLTVIKRAGRNRAGKPLWQARCVCGGLNKPMPVADYTKQKKRGAKPSCGCRRRETIGQQNTRHGRCTHPLYAVHRSMLARCLNPNHPAFHNYGGRGILVCARWRSFEAFYADVVSSYRPGLTLDRRDNDRDYEPGNTRWVTPLTQGNNKRANVHLTTPARTMTVAQAARHYGIGRSTLAYRLMRGCPSDRLFEKPDRRNRYTTSSTAGRVTAS